MHQKIVVICFMVALAMFGFSFAFSPLYNAFCKKTGFYAGTRIAINGVPQLNRDITVQFVTTVNRDFQWDFFPRTSSITVHPEENKIIYFFVKNKTHKTMTVQAIPSFAPPLAAQYFHKIQCFCFSQQTLKPGEERNMPVIFRVDQHLPNTIPTITLGYTLFDVTSRLTKRTAQ